MTKSKLIIIISSIVAAIAIAVTIILVVVLNSKPKPTNNDGNLGEARSIKIVQLEGSATLYDGTETINCFKGMNLYDGDHIDVSNDSVLVARFDEDKYVYFGQNTSINIKSVGKDKYKTNIFVEKGKVLAELINKLGEDEEFFLSSNNSVMAVRGTVFGVEVAETSEDYLISYSVYKGVTELYAFDKKDGNIISGKLTDLANKKIELTVPKSDVLTDEETKNTLNNWLKDIDNKFDDETDANKELEEVTIKVDVPSEEDYKDVIEKVSDETKETLSYSNIEYEAKSYYGAYDGNDHSISINPKTEGVKISYKANENDEYKNEVPSFKLPGSYRIYYKLEKEGFNSKEDYALVEIKKADLEIEYLNNITAPGLIKGMNINNAIKNINLFDYILLKGAEADAKLIESSTFEGNDKLKLGTNSYILKIILNDEIKDLYNDAEIEISLSASNLELDSTDVIYNGNLYIENITDFNRYNGVSEEELFNNAVFKAENTLYSSNDYLNVKYNYEYKTLGYYELKDGINEVEVEIEFEDYSLITDVSFNYKESRYSYDIDISVDDINVSKLSVDNYYYNTGNLISEDGYYHINNLDLINQFGLSNFYGYINLPTDVLDENSDNYLANDSQNYTNVKADELVEIEFLFFPSSSTMGCVKIINVYFSNNAPQGFPSYQIKDSLAYYPDTLLDFVISNDPVLYSLDDINYQNELSISNLGEHVVYFKVGNDIITKGKETILITTGSIYSNNLDLINEDIYIISDGNGPLEYSYNPGGESSTIQKELTSDDSTAISPFKDIYEIYTNIIKNATYYNDVTNEEIDVDINISEFEIDSPNFEYEIIADGYVSLKGNVNFIIPFNKKSTSGKEPIIENNVYDIELNVVNPKDRTVSLSDIDTVYASRIIYSIENITDDFSILYSIDEGKTWTDETPVFTEVGEYKIYSIYKYSNHEEYSLYYEDSSAIIIAIQNIIITE